VLKKNEIYKKSLIEDTKKWKIMVL
jgi:hypothetical protein